VVLGVKYDPDRVIVVLLHVPDDPGVHDVGLTVKRLIVSVKAPLTGLAA
jgi:hypothetical protein